MLLPAVRVQGEKGKQIDGGLEYIETVAGSVTGKVPERVTEKEKKISELLVEAPEAINGSPQVHTSYASH